MARTQDVTVANVNNLDFMYAGNPLMPVVDDLRNEVAMLRRQLAGADKKREKLERQLSAYTTPRGILDDDFEMTGKAVLAMIGEAD